MTHVACEQQTYFRYDGKVVCCSQAGTHVFHKRQRILQPSATKRFLSSLAIFSVLGSYLPSISEDIEALTFVSAYD